MSEALAAHLRLVAEYKDRTTTHKLEPAMKLIGQKMTDREKEALKADLLELQDRGITRKRMCVIARTTPKTVSRLLGKAKVGRPRKVATS
jgi:hypothetical protein